MMYDQQSLYGHNDVHYVDIEDTVCMDLCDQPLTDTLLCNSFDYNPDTRDCYLSTESQYTQPQSFAFHPHNMYYEK